MKTNTIITIGREYGSAGREIGYKVADAFGIKLYDKEMLSRAAKESGICEEIFETHDEKPTNSFLYSLVMDTYSMGYSGNTYTDMPINHKVFLAQFDAIKKIADEGPCILVGRCADYALEDFLFCRPKLEEDFWSDRHLVYGHTPTRLLRAQMGQAQSDDILCWRRQIAIDCGCGFGGKLGCLCLDTMETFYVE